MICEIIWSKVNSAADSSLNKLIDNKPLHKLSMFMKNKKRFVDIELA